MKHLGISFPMLFIKNFINLWSWKNFFFFIFRKNFNLFLNNKLFFNFITSLFSKLLFKKNCGNILSLLQNLK